MGKRRKALRAQELKQKKATRAFAYLRNCPIATRKVRLVANMVRGLPVDKALAALRYAPQASAPYVEKLLISAISNWGVKNPESRMEDAKLCVHTIMVDEGRTLKRIRPRAQGRAARILKRSSHIMIEVAPQQPAPERVKVSESGQGENADK